MADVDNSAWDGAAAMSRATNSDDPAAAYAAICAGYRAGDKSLQATWALPHHQNPGDPPNADGTRNALSRLPQTQGLVNEAEARAHLERHMEAISPGARSEEVPIEEGAIQVRDAAKRELDIRVVPWDHPVNTIQGLELFSRGAFADQSADKVLLMGMEHEVHFGLSQDGETPKLTRHPIGKGIAMRDAPDGQHVTFRVAKTARGDEVLALAEEGIVRGASIEFEEVPGGTVIEQRNGRRLLNHRRGVLRAVSTTTRPAYGEQAAVLAVRSQEAGDAPMAGEITTAPDGGAETKVAIRPEPDEAVQARSFEQAFAKIDAGFASIADRLTDRLEKLEDRARSTFVVPGTEPEKPSLTRAEWVSLVLRMRSGDAIPAAQMRAAEDVISSDNIGLVPPAYLTELIGVIDASRPFMGSTRRLDTPASGMQLVVPVITQRPTVAEQTTEKSTLSTQTTKISTTSFDMVTKGGYGDISLQLLKRADRSFLDLYLQLLAEAYAIEAESEAVEALLHANEPLNPDSLDPENLSLGAAYQTSFDAIRRPPDTIWLSTEAVGGFIDAKASTSNQPLYSNIQASATAGGGITGTIQGLRAVHVPALDAHGSYAIVGPSSGFAWAEDGTFTLQVDVPAKAGRDVALVGMLWFAPWYPDAFSIYNVAS